MPPIRGGGTAFRDFDAFVNRRTDHRLVSAGLLLALLACGAVGCSRAWWRSRADGESYAAMQGKLDDPRWAVPRVDVTPDPRSRMFDPHDPDRPPMPPEGPVDRALMLRPAGKRGSKAWAAFGRTCFNDNPNWETPFPPVGDTSLEERIERSIPADRRLTLEQLVELSYLHSRNYQTQIETLYLAALDLTFDRFLFTVRHRGISGLEPGADLQYANVPGTSDNLTLNSRWGIRRLLPTGTQLTAELANQTLWMFAGPNQTNTLTIASYSIVQPLLLGAGRKVVLEDLVQSERNVLYAARDLARFRRTLFVDTVSGGQSGGLLGLLLQRQQILNTEANIEELAFQVLVLTELQSRPPREFETELRPTAAPLLEAEVPAALTDKLSIRRHEADLETRVLFTWTLPMTATEATAIETFIGETFGDDRATARFVLGRVREDVIGPARDEQFVEFDRPLPEGLGVSPGDVLPGTFRYRVGGELKTGSFGDFARYESLESGDGFRLVWNGPMLLEQEDALLALADNPEFTAIVERLATTTRARQSLDIAQLTTRLLNTRNALRTSQRAYRDALDQYKIELGLPPDVLLPIDECLLREFQLIDPRISNPSRGYDVQPTDEASAPTLPILPLPGEDAGAEAGDDPGAGGEDDILPSAPPLDGAPGDDRGLEQRLLAFVDDVYSIDGESDVRDIRRVLARLVALEEDVGEFGVGLVREDLESLRAAIPDIRADLPGPIERERLQRDFERDQRRFEVIAGRYTELSAAIGRLQLDVAGEIEPDRLPFVVNEMRSVREELLKLVRELKVVQIGARVERIQVQPAPIPLDEAIATALCNRVDLMNQRAFVTDARRQMEVTANALKAILDVRAEGEQDIGENATSSHRVGVAFSTPLDRQAERNAYRAAIITFQQSKRAYTLFEDNVKLQVRQSWRRLQVLRENFEVSRQALRFSAAQLDQAAESALQPLRAGQSGGGNQGLNLLNALNAVLNAQNALIRNWVDYETARLTLYRDMGIMDVDGRGLWRDDFYQTLSGRCRGNGSLNVVPPTLPEPTHDGAANPDDPANPPAPAGAGGGNPRGNVDGEHVLDEAAEETRLQPTEVELPGALVPVGDELAGDSNRSDAAAPTRNQAWPRTAPPAPPPARLGSRFRRPGR